MIEDRDFKQLGERNVALSRHSTYGVGGNAGFFAMPETLEALLDTIRYCQKRDLAFMILGHGSNILFPDKPKEDKVFISLKRFIDYSMNESQVFFTAGTPLSLLALMGAVFGESRFDFTFLLPGTLGAGIYINAKCYEAQIGEIVQTVYYVDPTEPGFAIKAIKAEDCEFGYKKSIFQRQPWVIVGADFAVSSPDEAGHKYIEDLLPRTRNVCENFSSLSAFYTFFETEASHLPNIPSSFKTIRDYRNGKHHFDYPSCGSVFKNNYSFGSPMGAIIEKLDLLGKQWGGAMISPYHGNIIINAHHAQSGDVTTLIEQVQTAVKQACGFWPEPEVIIVKE